MPQTIEERVTLLEREMQKLRRPQTVVDSGMDTGNNRWVNTIFGAFKDDPLFEEAVKAGEEYRKAQVPDYMKDDSSADVPA
ncbi:hypothetical protein [Armatimonas sp.]|uniref:hypothetical protein n=1 Tax=Armatimonas sp. TaxID=1872638 RepID=UPI0037522591